MLSVPMAVLALLGLPAMLACAYLLVLTLLSGALPTQPPSARRLRFDVVVPAHDEAAVIERVLASLARLDWPADRFRILVVADNCTDDTASRAAAQGAVVLERCDGERRGKGFALEHAFGHCLAQAWADALVVIDADTAVSPNLLEAFACRIEHGAQAVQAHYGVLNAMESWRTRLITIAHGAFHEVRSRARERLGLSCGLRGNGWCATAATLRRVPFGCFSLTEDLEYGIRLGMAGVRVHYADEAHADAEMTSSAAVASGQRKRWEQGRFALVRRYTGPLLSKAWRDRDRLCLDLALDLMVPPLSYLLLHLGAWTGAALAMAAFWPSTRPLLGWALIADSALVAHVLRGWQLSGVGLQGLADLLRVPGFLYWKLRLLGEERLQQWQPTSRKRA